MAKWRPIVERERREAQEAKEARNSLLTAPTTVTDSGSMYGRSSEHLTQNAEAPAGYGRADDWVDPYVRHPYSNDQFSSSSVALTATPHPKSMRTGPLLEPSIYVQPPPAASSDELQPREELDAYARRQDHAYNAVISVPPQSRRPSAQPVPHPLQAPQHTYNPYDQSSQHHPSPLMQQHGSPYLQQDQPRTYPYQDSWSAPRSSADFYSEDNHGPRDSRYFGQAM